MDVDEEHEVYGYLVPLQPAGPLVKLVDDVFKPARFNALPHCRN